jgi:hypothetical protein
LRRRAQKTGLALLGAAALCCTLAPPAGAELSAHGDLFVNFKGGISPTTLPRQALAPIAVRVSGLVRTPPGSTPPPLRQIEVAINRNGHLDTTGLPVCQLAQIEGATSAGALAVCKDALVGSGAYAAKASFPEQATFPAQGEILAFNGRSEGRPVILAHLYGTHPASGASLITFYIHRLKSGAYGTVLNGVLPPALNHYGYVTQISLKLHRTFTYKGRRRSYLSAACAAPAGFPFAVFPFARASMRFEGGVTLASTLTRSCRVAR